MSSCNSRKLVSSQSDTWTCKEAQLFDVPIPIDAKPEKKQGEEEPVKGSCFEVSFRSGLTLSDVILFYQQEMERLGWAEYISFVGCQANLIFEKPSKIVSIAIIPTKKDLRITIFQQAR